MAQYMAKVNDLAAAEGISANPMDQAPLMILENEVENLEAENAAKQEILRTLDERLEIAKAELKAEQEVSSQYEKIVGDDVETISGKNIVLQEYIKTLESADEFRINKVAQKLTDQLTKYFADIKQIIEKARAFNVELNELSELKKKYEQLQKESGQEEV